MDVAVAGIELLFAGKGFANESRAGTIASGHRFGTVNAGETAMSSHSPKLIATLLIASVGLAACGDHDRPRVDRGPVINETREAGDFDSISLRGSARLIVSIGDAPSLKISGPERVVQGLTTEVEGDTLVIRSKRKEWTFGRGDSRLTVNVTMPKLEELRLEGSNDVRLNGYNGGESRIDIEGAANLEANGQLDDLTVHMAGAGRANLRDLIAANATVTVDGVGSVHVNATESLDATMNGVGAILYSGTPRDVNTSMNGVGTISKDRDRKDKESQEERETAPIDPDTLQPEYEKTEVSTQPTSGVI